MSDNVKTVQEIYAAFGRGDVPTILSALADDVEWEYGQSGKNNAPWLQPRRGRDAVAGFFESLGGIEMHKFSPKEVFGQGDVVVALIDIELTVRATGKRIVEEDEIHVWRFNDAGKVAKMRHGADMHAHEVAIAG